MDLHKKLLNSRIERLNRFIVMNAPTFITAHALVLAMESAEKANSPRLKDLKIIEGQLKGKDPDFEGCLLKVLRDANLRAAGFCITPGCKSSALEDSSFCKECEDEATKDLEQDGQVDFDNTPEGKAMMEQMLEELGGV